MIVYVNGDSHAAAAEAVVPFGWAEDDPFFWGMGKRPHPDNEKVSFGCEIANNLNAIYDCDAQSGASNARILRTTRNWIENNDIDQDTLVIIQWSTWEREEWYIDNDWYQVGSSGIDSVPENYQTRYKEFVANVNWQKCTEFWHNQIWQLHQDLLTRKIRHVFFNGNNHFASMLERRNWGCNFINPYDATQTFDHILRQNGYKTVNENSWHFGADAHCFWADFMLHYINHHNI